MPTQPGTAERRAAAGWYPDPLGPPGQLRWWDGQAWSSSVRSPDAPTQRTATPKPERPPRRKRRVIGWAAIGAFALGASGVVIAVKRGQDVCEVSATGIKFCASDDESRQEIEQGQPAIEEQASELQSQAQEQATGETAPGTADLSGTWQGDNGFTYVIEQFGDEAVISEIGFGGMITSVGGGVVDESLFTFDFQAIDGSFGTGSLQLDGDTLTGSFDNAVSGLSTPAVLRR
jgi:hypothetical protein